MKVLTFKLEQFEGPLDLLLYLVSKNKMNLYDIEIVSLIDQYVSVVHELSPEQMESASEFIEMAARLVQMKSYFLLPKSEEAERIKEELTGLLVEYSLCKKVAAKLKTMQENVYYVVRSPMEIQFDTEYRLHHDVYLLENAYNSLQGRSLQKRTPQQERFEPLTAAPFVSVGSRIITVLRGLVTGRVKKLRQLFKKDGSRSQTVATFLAVLELVRAGRIEIGTDETLTVKRKREDKKWNSDN
ncbi:ScpA family protein [uncultured Ruthenibacterium sp.]|uniref:segregation and condensation protein A n=1 Tax=uncultured Ruthenibacterium sp. TaxID=1905347 RepID=UPI00349E9E7F